MTLSARLALLLCLLLAGTGCSSVSVTRNADGSITVEARGEEPHTYALTQAQPLTIETLDSLALRASGGDWRSAHEALLTAADAVWAMGQRLAGATAPAEQAARANAAAEVLRNAAAAQREAGQ